MHHRKVVYTALFGNYDHLISAPKSSDDVCYVCFTDQEILDPKGWRIIQVDSKATKLSKAMLNRYYKINPHLFFSKYQCSLYIDANIEIIKDPSPLFDIYLANNDVAVPKHFSRDCIFSEAKECIIVGKDNARVIHKQMRKYKSQGMPNNYGLGENNIIFRNHNSKEMKILMEEWWREMNSESSRDQLSFAYVLWNNNTRFIYMLESARVGKGFFKYHAHNKSSSGLSIPNIINKLMTKFREMKYSDLKF